MSPGDKSNAVENRLKKDIDNLKREKKILLEDTEVRPKTQDFIHVNSTYTYLSTNYTFM
jgi:hypothetical protein